MVRKDLPTSTCENWYWFYFWIPFGSFAYFQVRYWDNLLEVSRGTCPNSQKKGNLFVAALERYTPCPGGGWKENTPQVQGVTSLVFSPPFRWSQQNPGGSMKAWRISEKFSISRLGTWVARAQTTRSSAQWFICPRNGWYTSFIL